MSETRVTGKDTQFTHAEEAVEWINSLIPFGIRPGLERIELLMERFGNPERRLKFIHVAGTNGKGSTCAMLTSVLLEAGFDVGTFTSPYIEKYQNRLKYNNEDIADETLVELTNRLRPVVEEIASTPLGSPTMFEVSVALAFLYYGTVTYPDVVVLETGLGGRLDVTNIVTPILSVITNIGHDHMDILGNTIEEIAFEKAGIIKAGVPVVTAVEQPEALEVIRKAAVTKKSALYVMGEQFRYEPKQRVEDAQTFSFTGPFRALDDITITMNGVHQLKNAAVTVMALEVLRTYLAFIIDEDLLLAGMYKAAWPGRLEMIRRNPRILIDGAHNPEGMATLAQALKDTYSYKRCHIVMGMLSTKHHPDALRHILPLADTVIFTEPNFRKKLAASELAAIAKEVLGEQEKQPEFVIEPDWRSALAKLQSITSADDLGVVTGTLYLIADVRSYMLYQMDSEKGW